MLKGRRDPGSREGELLGTAAAGGAVPKFPAERSGPVLGVGARSPGKAGRGGSGRPLPLVPSTLGDYWAFRANSKTSKISK